MMITWMAYGVGITTIAYLAAAAAERLFWIWRAPRRVAWISALVIAIAAPIVIPVWRGASRPSPAAVPAVATPAAWSLTLLAPPHQTPASGAVTVEPTRIGAPSAMPPQVLSADSTLLTIWLVASALLLLFAALSFLRLEAQSATWPEMTIDGTRVLVSPNRGPAVFGIWRQRIVLPCWTLSLDAQSRALMLRHECEHLRARDSQYLLMATLAALLFPWNAALWLLVKRFRLAIELDCDDRVLSKHADTHAYGSLLLAVSARRGREMPLAVALAERSSMLERRIRAMTAVTPTRRVLVSIPLLATFAVLTLAAARTPSPRPALLHRHRTTVAPPKAASATRVDAHIVSAAIPARPRSRLASPESLPHISGRWENAPIENVVAAFATFSHRRITIATGVSGLVTATVIDQPWQAALKTIMARQGLQVEFRADSSLYISLQQESRPRQRDIDAAAQVSRAVSGLVDDAQTGAPIGDARIAIVGAQLVGGANETSSDERGRFSLSAPDGEVSLQACASGYQFRRVTLGPTDSLAVFHGYKTAQHGPSDTVRISRKDIESVEVMKGQAAAAMYGAAAANGVIELTMKDGTVTHIPVGPDGPTPVLIIDDKVAHDCATELWWVHFRLF